MRCSVLYLVIVSVILFVAKPGLTQVPIINAVAETTPIPAGTESSDDAAIWFHPKHPERSRIVGVSKNKKRNGGNAGLGLYSLEGRQLQYILHDRLNNADLRYDFPYRSDRIDIVGASNRDKRAISVFSVDENRLKLLADLPIKDEAGRLIDEEPYGFCLALDKTKEYCLYALSPMKSGLIYQHQIMEEGGTLRAKFIRVIDTSKFLMREVDQHLIEMTVRETIYESELPKEELVAEVIEELSERFQLEGCVADDELGFFYYGMENLGVWKTRIDPRFRPKATLIARIVKAKSEPGTREFTEGVPRLVNDIEGMAIHYGPSGKGALCVSIQGLDEYAFFDRRDHKYLGSFKLRLPKADPVTETDGLDILSSPLGRAFPEGILVVHDHHNTNDAGELLNGNYKIVSLKDVLEHFPTLRYRGYTYNPRR